jgi:hypothetical protein
LSIFAGWEIRSALFRSTPSTKICQSFSNLIDSFKAIVAQRTPEEESEFLRHQTVYPVPFPAEKATRFDVVG